MRIARKKWKNHKKFTKEMKMPRKLKHGVTVEPLLLRKNPSETEEKQE